MKKNNTVLRAIVLAFSLIIIFGCGYYIYEKYFNIKIDQKDNQKPDEKADNKSISESNDEVYVKYGILSTKDINPFKNLDFSKKAYGDEIDFDKNGIIIENREEDPAEKIRLPIQNVKQVGLVCHCGGCYGIYYLTENGELYNIKFSHQDGLGSLKEVNLKAITTLVSKSVKHFALFDLDIIDPTTCGGSYLVYETIDDKQYIEHSDKIYNTSKFKRLIIEGSFYDNIGFVEGSELYVVSKDVKVTNYLKDTKSNNIIAKSIYTFSGNSEDGDGEPFFLLYVLNEDDYLYYFEDYIKEKAELVKEAKVKNIKQRDDDILVTFEDGSEEAIDATEFKIK